jgi:hypothetical protein
MPAFRSFALLALVAASCSDQGPVARNVLPPPPPPSGAANLLLYTTLDDVAAVLSPTQGSGVGAVITTAPANDFVPARVGNGLRADALGERIQLPQVAGSVQNVELDRGTIEFWYRPNYNHDDNLKYTLVGTGNWSGSPPARGSLHLGKHNNSNNNAIFLIFYDANAVRYEHDVPVTAYGWRAGDWILVRLTWDFGLPAGQQNLHLYLNGRELPLTGEVARGSHPIPAERPDEKIYIGSRDVTGTIISNGVFDEVRIWNRAVPPS